MKTTKVKKVKAIKAKKEKVKAPSVESTNIIVHGNYDGKNYVRPFQVQRERKGVFSIKDGQGRVIETVIDLDNEKSDIAATSECQRLNSLFV